MFELTEANEPDRQQCQPGAAKPSRLRARLRGQRCFKVIVLERNCVELGAERGKRFRNVICDLGA